MKQKRPDLILLDLMLPGMSGEKVPSQIQGIPIIVVSAKTDADSKVNLLLGELEERVAVVDKLMKEGKVAFLQDYVARKRKEEVAYGEER